MKTGGFSPILLGKILRFNGSLFEQATALPLTADQLGLLIDAGEKQWREVEPAIFGTLLERALDKNERHKLGAHFTPRAYVERLVLPTIVDPLREQWANVQAAAVTLAKGDDLPGARKVISEFLDAALQHDHPRSGVRNCELPLRGDGAYEAARGRGLGHAPGPG